MVELFEAGTDHGRGASGGHVVVEYGDYECPYSAAAYRVIRHLQDEVMLRFVFRHFPLIAIHPRALSASYAAEAAACQGSFWQMHDWLFRHQKTLTDDDLRTGADDLALDVARFDLDRASGWVLERVRRDILSGLASGEVRGTPTLFIDGAVHQGGFDRATLKEAFAL